MRSLSVILSLLLFSLKVHAQTEMIIPWSDTFSLFHATHNVDENGNVYILGTLYFFDNGPGTPIEGLPTVGSVLLKMDNQNRIIFRKLFPIASANGMIYEGLLPARQMYLLDSGIFVPYHTSLGYTTCGIDSNLGIPTFRNGGLSVNKINGNVIKSKYFDDEQPCSDDDLLYCAIRKNGNSIYVSSSYVGYGAVIYLNERDKDWSLINTTKTSSDTIVGDGTFIYDSVSDNFILRRRNTLKIYNTQMGLLKTLTLPDSIPTNATSSCIAYNSKYYALNISNPSKRYNTPYSYTAVFSRSGTMISLAATPVFKDMLMMEDGELYGITESRKDSAQKPVTFTQMDLFLNIKRQKQLGTKYLTGCKLSVTKNKEVVITGTSYTSNPDNVPKTPDGIYLYREKLENIPLIASEPNVCDNVRLLPNPATNTLTLESSDYTITSGATIELFDVAGRKMNEAKWSTQVWVKDISSYPTGVYIVTVRNNQNVCNYKIVKE